MKSINGKYWMGWRPDYPDFRDYTVANDNVKPMFGKVGVLDADGTSLPKSVDLRKWCSPVEDQGMLGSCTANAGVGLVEYFERKAFGKHIDASRLFLYKATRTLMHETGDTGAFLRTTMGALALFGVPPEEYWPYDVSRFDEEPVTFCYAFAQNYQSIKYVRLDPANTPSKETLGQVKANLAAGMPAMFGFTVYSSITQAEKDGKIPFPSKGERIEGGHAVLAVGYDDALKVKNEMDGRQTTGAFLIRNSWGIGWGCEGYGWLPYEYALKGLAEDWWTLIDGKWVDTGEFKL
ncbi:Cysteine protease [Methanocella conradii HZ254]|uniref:Cysteine protease n=1 Tax=Methanocella conradii (strain DSM 24694 / JCM 17849 / CGMCC 1.5162 / HZ254) TaxID=1041930 RepID=H8I837_METCZ|nr:C1 family peptidase [Methanocella conradii]AFD00855.1 Cysteine protease [Methanocella conradii HZ254]MDI6897536.1 C1 family peptidase [Methanocella conradii]